MGAPKTASAASPSNLLTNPWCRSTSSTITAKKRFSSSTTSVAGRPATNCVEPIEVDEDDRDVTLLAAEFRALLFGRGGHLAADVAAEQIPHALALTQAGDHRVEAALQLPEFGAVEHHQVGVEVALARRGSGPPARPGPG